MHPHLEDFLSAAERAELEQPTGQAVGLPGRLYAAPEFFELERQTLIRRTWMAVAVASELPNSGDVQPVSAVGWSLVLVRDMSGELNVFHNICRHRGTAVVTGAAEQQRVLQCPWHGWCYELDGTLRGTPEIGGVGQHESDGVDKTRHGLAQVRSEVWLDIVFVNLDGKAPPLNVYLGAFNRRFESVDFSSLKRAGTWSMTYPCNWKLAVESGIEDYHLPHLHPLITDGPVRGDRSVMESDDDVFFLCGEVSRSQWAEGRGGDNLPALPAIPGLQGDDAVTLFFGHLFPTVVMGMLPDSLYFGIWLPDGPHRTSLTFHHYFVAEGATGPALEPTRSHIISSLQEIFSQDVPVVAATQTRAAERDALGISQRFSPYWETVVHAFQKTVIKNIAESSDRDS
jgi:choline monooxygenase